MRTTGLHGGQHIKKLIVQKEIIRSWEYIGCLKGCCSFYLSLNSRIGLHSLLLAFVCFELGCDLWLSLMGGYSYTYFSWLSADGLVAL